MITASMLCGEERVELSLPDKVRIMSPKQTEPMADPEAEVRGALEKPTAGPPLVETARGRGSACVVISDFTRPVPNRIILPPLLAALEEAGIDREKITILIATGMHRPNLGQELTNLVGQEIVDGYRIVNHYCRKPEFFRYVGRIEGTPIDINTLYLDAELKILTGLIEPHMYAGYSGGRKSILPGISSFRTMRFMHSFEMIDHPQVRNCTLEGNPFHEAGLKVMDLVGADFILNVVIDQERRLAGVFAGDPQAAHLAGCEMVRENSTIRLPERVEAVITSGGGFPLDATFYQVSKGLTIARDMLKKGGSILCLAECREGLGGPEFCQVMREGRSPEDFMGYYCVPDNFVIDQWCSQTIYQALAQAGEVHLYAPGLPAEDIERMGMIRVEDPRAAAAELCRRHESVVAVPEGPYVVGIVD